MGKTSQPQKKRNIKGMNIQVGKKRKNKEVKSRSIVENQTLLTKPTAGQKAVVEGMQACKDYASKIPYF